MRFPSSNVCIEFLTFRNWLQQGIVPLGHGWEKVKKECSVLIYLGFIVSYDNRSLRSIVVVRSLRKRKVTSSILVGGSFLFWTLFSLSVQFPNKASAPNWLEPNWAPMWPIYVSSLFLKRFAFNWTRFIFWALGPKLLLNSFILFQLLFHNDYFSTCLTSSHYHN